LLPKPPHHGGHGLDAARRHRDFLAPVVGIGDPDAARRRPQVAMEIVDGDNPEIDRGRLRGGGCRTQAEYQQGREKDLDKRTFHAVMLEGQYNDFTMSCEWRNEL
jgi:hypothetical protein